MSLNVDIPAWRAYLAEVLGAVEIRDGVPLPVAPFPWSNPQGPLVTIQTGQPWISSGPQYGQLALLWKVKVFVQNNHEDAANAELDDLVTLIIPALIDGGFGIVNASEYRVVLGQSLLYCEITVSDLNDIQH